MTPCSSEWTVLNLKLHELTDLCVLAMKWSNKRCFIVFAIFGCVIIVSVQTLVYCADRWSPGAVTKSCFVT